MIAYSSETERKKEYLSRYRKSRNLEQQCREELAQLYIDVRVPSAKVSDGMPHAPNSNRDLSDAMAQIERYELNLIKQINRSEALRVEIADAITAVEDDDEKAVLRKMYLSDARPSMEDIGQAMYISRSSAWRLLNRAIDNFKMPLAMAPGDKSFLFSEVETV